MSPRCPTWVASLLLVGVPAFGAEPTVSWKLFSDSATSPTAQAETGKVDFLNACAVCHAAEPDRPGTMSLQFKYAGRFPAALERRTDLTVEIVTYYVRHGIAMMPSFRKTELSDAEVAAIAAYLTRRPARPR
jgi:mono/diheme cytochrome c family protein